MLLGKSRFLKPAYSIFLYMTGVKYKWQLQFVNKEAEWQEFDSFQNKSEDLFYILGFAFHISWRESDIILG